MNEDIDPTAVLDPPDVDLTPTPDPTPDPVPDPTPAPAPSFDPEAMSRAIAEGIKAGQPAPKAEPLTPEQAKKLLRVWEPSDEFSQRLMNVETQKAALAEMRDGLLQQFDTIAQMRLREQQEQFNSRLTPIQQHYENLEATARESRFNSAFPDLAKPEMKPIVASIISGLVAQKALVGKSEAEIFKAIGATAEAFLRQANPAFKLTPAGSTPAGQQKQGTGLKPSTSGSGGGGGGKSNAGDGAPKATALKFL